MIFIVLIIFLSIICVLLITYIFVFDFIPFIKKRNPKPIKTIEFINVGNLKIKVADAGIKMLQSTKMFMSYSDNKSFYDYYLKVRLYIAGNRINPNFFFFPRALLMNGLFDMYKVDCNKNIFHVLEQEINKVCDYEGNLKFTFDKIDQATFGLVLLSMYEENKSKSLSNALKNIETEILSFVQKDSNHIFYRKGVNALYVDTIGMVCPFLYRYGTAFNRLDLVDLANTQINYFINNCLDESSKFPFHAFDLNNNLRVGPTNWARGVGWFLLGLSYSLKYTDEKINPNYKLFKLTFEQIFNKLDTVKINKTYWPQFLGYPFDNNIDTSATLLFYYSAQIAGYHFENESFINSIVKSIDQDGYVINSTGDTFGINRYAYASGKSELTQGLLLSVLSKN